MNDTQNGVPVLTMQKKLDALKYCIENDAHEDAVGHLLDLLFHLDPSQEIAAHHLQYPRIPIKTE
tara:strand:+ start:50881 stop:51075 length:195 start_codon:yes stop_codon:yes gene_type:complete